MKEYKIIDNGFYFPRTEQWIMDTFDLRVDRALLYQVILNKGFVTWSQEWMANVLRCSVDKIKDILKELIDKEIVIKKSFNVSDSSIRMRNVYVALYDAQGKRSDELVNRLLAEGEKKIELEYSEKRYYKKKK